MLLFDHVFLQVLPGMNIVPLNSVLSEGMNPKKKHEVSDYFCISFWPTTTILLSNSELVYASKHLLKTLELKIALRKLNFGLNELYASCYHVTLVCNDRHTWYQWCRCLLAFFFLMGYYWLLKVYYLWLSLNLDRTLCESHWVVEFFSNVSFTWVNCLLSFKIGSVFC